MSSPLLLVLSHFVSTFNILVDLTYIYLLFGSSVCAVSIFRITTVSQLSNTADLTYVLCKTNIWSFVEPGCGIIGACLLTLKPLVPRVFKTSSSAYRISSQPGNGEDESSSGGGRVSRGLFRSRVNEDSGDVQLGQLENGGVGSDGQALSVAIAPVMNRNGEI